MPRSRLLIAAVALILAVGVGGYIAYDQVLSGDNVAPLALSMPAPSTSASVPAAGSGTATPADTGAPAGATTEPTPSADGDVAGTWMVVSGSEAGYRVRERLANLSAESDAVGRTPDITGSITIESDGAAIIVTAGALTVDTTTIASDESRRDNRMRSEGLQTDSFPTASLTLTAPVEVPGAALTGTASDVTLIGDLTLHGVTRSVSIAAQARLVEGTIEVAGSLGFALSDFEIVAPNVGGFIVSIADHGVLEFAVNFAKS